MTNELMSPNKNILRDKNKKRHLEAKHDLSLTNLQKLLNQLKAKGATNTSKVNWR